MLSRCAGREAEAGARVLLSARLSQPGGEGSLLRQIHPLSHITTSPPFLLQSPLLFSSRVPLSSSPPSSHPPFSLPSPNWTFQVRLEPVFFVDFSNSALQNRLPPFLVGGEYTVSASSFACIKNFRCCRLPPIFLREIGVSLNS